MVWLLVADDVEGEDDGDVLDSCLVSDADAAHLGAPWSVCRRLGFDERVVLRWMEINDTADTRRASLARLLDATLVAADADDEDRAALGGSSPRSACARTASGASSRPEDRS